MPTRFFQLSILYLNEPGMAEETKQKVQALSQYYKSQPHSVWEEVRIQSQHSEEDAKNVVLSALQRQPLKQ